MGGTVIFSGSGYKDRKLSNIEKIELHTRLMLICQMLDAISEELPWEIGHKLYVASERIEEISGEYTQVEKGENLHLSSIELDPDMIQETRAPIDGVVTWTTSIEFPVDRDKDQEAGGSGELLDNNGENAL